MTSTQPMGRLPLVVMAIATTGVVGCATNTFKVPAAEVQRLAQLPAGERGRQVRVVPWDSDAAVAQTQESPAMDDIAPVWNGDVYLDLSPPARNRAPRSRASWSGSAPTPGPPRPIASAGTFRGSPPGAPAPAVRGSSGGWRGSPPPSSSRPSPSPARFSAPSFPSPHGSPSGHQRGGGSADAGDAIFGVLMAVVIVAGAAALIADTAAEAEKASAYARSFDGWVTVGADHVISLRYHNGMEREVPLSRLTPADAAGVLYGYLREIGGPVVPLQEPWEFRDPPPSPPPSPDDQWDG